jgi:hypothetical protein
MRSRRLGKITVEGPTKKRKIRQEAPHNQRENFSRRDVKILPIILLYYYTIIPLLYTYYTILLVIVRAVRVPVACSYTSSIPALLHL